MSLFNGIQNMNLVNNESGTSFLNINVSGQAEVNNLMVSGSATLPASVFPACKNVLQYCANANSLLASFANTIGQSTAVGGDVNSTTELGSVCPYAGTLKNLLVSCRFNSIIVNGNLTLTVYKATGTGNYESTAITCTVVPISNTVVNASNLSNTLSVSAGDRIALSLSSGAVTMAFSLAGGLGYEV